MKRFSKVAAVIAASVTLSMCSVGPVYAGELSAKVKEVCTGTADVSVRMHKAFATDPKLPAELIQTVLDDKKVNGADKQDIINKVKFVVARQQYTTDSLKEIAYLDCVVRLK